MIKKPNKGTPKKNVLKIQPIPSVQRTTTIRAPKVNIDTHTARVCGLIDPFCDHARGAKYPDESSSRTLAFTAQWNQTLTTNATGYSSIIFSPRFTSDGSGMTSTTTVVAGVATSVNFAPASVALLSGASKYRVVSAGVRLRNISPLLTASGVVNIRSYSDPSCSALTSYTIDNCQAAQVRNVSVVDCKDVHLIAEHSSQLPQIFYVPTTTSIAADTGSGFCPMTISINGGPASTATLYLEFIVHVEFVFDDSAPLALAATPAPVFNPIISTVTKKISSESVNFFSKSLDLVSRSIRTRAYNYLSSLLISAPNPLVKTLGAGMQILEVD